MWTYDSANGNLSQDGSFVVAGYSGIGDGLNNPAEEMDADIGPIPRGDYTIDPFFDDPGGKGPIVAHLIPAPETATFNRSGFMIHGDNAAMNHTASHGCIILDREIRQRIAASGDTALEVV
jgi:hypothetical protein